MARARELRRTGTEPEALLRRYLRNRNLAGFKFTRQEPIGCYIADFACRIRKLVIELDGRHHDSRIDEDDRRTAALQRLGYQVVRFSNADALRNVEAVVSEISRLLAEKPPHPSPLPEGERGLRA